MLVIIEIIPYKTFKEKIRIVKAYDGKAFIEVTKGYIYIERYEKQGGMVS